MQERRPLYRSVTTLNNLFKPSHQPPTTCVKTTFDLTTLTMTSQPVKNISLTSTAKLAGEFLLPLAKGKNTNCAEAEAQLLKWMEETKLAAKASASNKKTKLNHIYEKAEKLKAAWLFSTPLIAYSIESLVSSAKSIAFLFAFDDLIDKHIIEKIDAEKIETEKINQKGISKAELIAEVKTITDCFYSILSGTLTKEDQLPKIAFPNEDYFYAFCNALFDLRNHISGNNLAYLESLDLYFKSIVNEIDGYYRELLETAEETERKYLEGRKHTGAVIVTFELIALLCKIDVSSSARKDPLFIQFVEEASLALGLLNDIVSSIKEANEALHTNMISIKYDIHVREMIETLLIYSPLFKNTYGFAQEKNQPITLTETDLFDLFRSDPFNQEYMALMNNENIKASCKEFISSFVHQDQSFNPLQKAINDTIKKHNDQMLKIFALQTSLYEKYRSNTPVIRFMELVSDCLQDNCEWSMSISERYRTDSKGNKIDFQFYKEEINIPNEDKCSLNLKAL